MFLNIKLLFKSVESLLSAIVLNEECKRIYRSYLYKMWMERFEKCHFKSFSTYLTAFLSFASKATHSSNISAQG